MVEGKKGFRRFDDLTQLKTIHFSIPELVQNDVTAIYIYIGTLLIYYS